MNKKKIGFYIIIILALALLGYFVYRYSEKIKHLISPFFIAAIIVYMVKPLAAMLTKRGAKSSVAILSIYGLFTAVITAACIFVFPELVKNTKELMTTLPNITNEYQQKFNSIISMVKSSKLSDDIKVTLFNEITKATGTVQNYAVGALGKTLDMLVQMVKFFVDVSLAMFIAYYIIKDSERLKKRVLSLSPRRWRNWLTAVGRDINAILENFIQGQLLTALIVGVLETIGLIIAGVKYPIVLGVIGGLSNVIPYFGPYIGAVPAVAIALVQSPITAVWAIVVFLIVQQIDNSFISPKIIEGSLGLHPVTTMFVVLAGGEFFGIIGMLVSVPVIAILKAVVVRTIEVIV